jgi:hypothetical protein
LLLSPSAVTDRSVAIAQTLTKFKFAAVAIAALQLLLLLLWSGWQILVHALR